jgi:hypothetical protein
VTKPEVELFRTFREDCGTSATWRSECKRAGPGCCQKRAKVDGCTKDWQIDARSNQEGAVINSKDRQNYEGYGSQKEKKLGSCSRDIIIGCLENSLTPTNVHNLLRSGTNENKHTPTFASWEGSLNKRGIITGDFGVWLPGPDSNQRPTG